VTLFFLGGATCFVGDLFSIAPRWAYPVFWFFPPNYFAFALTVGESRLGGISAAGLAAWTFLMVKYGIRGIFLSGKPLRLVMFIVCILTVFLGGFRAHLFFIGLVFVFGFFLEGLHRTKLLPVFTVIGLFAIAAIVPLASKLPFTFQRTLAFLPLPLSPEAKGAAQETLDWRLNMWKALLPQVPEHLLLGKGFAITPEEYNEMMGRTALNSPTGAFDPSQDAMALSYDYHNGPLSVILPFGIWGVIAFVWFLVAGLGVMYDNFRYGDPSLHTINMYLLVNFLVSLIVFIFVGGGMASDMARFAGFLGLSIALNGGVCRLATHTVQAEGTLPRPAHVLTQPRPAFPR
jgi:hypothetical protein